MTPPAKSDSSFRPVAAATGEARHVSAPVEKSAPAKKAPAKKAALKSVGGAGTKAPVGKNGKGGLEAPPDTELVDGDVLDIDLDEAVLEDVVAGELAVDPALTADVVVDLETDEVVLTVSKKRTLDDVDESTFEPVEVAKLETELTEDQGFTLSEADDADEPEQQVMAAGATADPVKDYLKQIGKVALLNAEQEVELAKRIEAGLFADEKINDERTSRSSRARPRTSAGSPRTVAGPRTTCWRPTCDWWSRWPSATPAAACSSST